MKKRLLKILLVTIYLFSFLAGEKAIAQTVTYTPVTADVTTQTSIYNGQSGLVIYAVKASTTSTTTISNARIFFSTTISNPTSSYFSNLSLSVSTTGTYAGSTVIATSASGIGQNNPGTITATTTSNITITPATPVYFYLVAGLSYSSGPIPVSCTIDINSLFSYYPSVTYNNSASNTSKTYTLALANISSTGYNDPTINGITPGSISYGQTGIVLFGFSLTIQGGITINTLNIGSNVNVNPYFTAKTSNALYKSTTPYFSDAIPIAASQSTFGGSSVTISNLTETFSANSSTTNYYFIVADFTANNTYTSPATITFNFTGGNAINASSGTPITVPATTNGRPFPVISTYEWRGGTSSDFNDVNNFKTVNNNAVGSLPNSTIAVRIGVVGYTNPPIIGVSAADANVGELLFGAGQTNPTLTINTGRKITVTSSTVILTGSTPTIAAGGTGIYTSTGSFITGTGATTTISAPVTLTTTSGLLTNNGTINLSGTGAITAAGASGNTGTINNNGTGALTFSNSLSNTGNINQTAAGAVNITGTLSNTSGSKITQSGSGTLTLSADLTHATGATISQTGTGIITFSSTLNNTGTITQSSTGTITFTGAVTNNSGGIITQTGAGIANFAADVTNSSGGILTPGAGTGTSNFAGTTITNNSATPITFNNVNINNSISLAGSGTFSVNNTGTLTVATGKIFAAGTNMLRLKSGASGSAAVGPLAGTSTITGSVNVERWVTGGASATYRGYRLISSPVNISGAATGNIDLGYINNTSNSNGLGALIGGPGGSTNGFDLDIANPSVYVYREDWTATSTGFNGGKHKGITKINSTGSTSNVAIATGATTAASANYTIPAGTGYIFYDIGSTAQPGNQAAGSNPASFAITAKGYLNQGTIPVKNWFTPASNYLSYTGTTSAGYNMLGNPYAAPIDLNKVISLNPKIANFIYELSNDNSAGQVYKAYKSTGGSDPTTSRYILSGQGFIVKATDATTTFSFTEAMKDLSGTQVPLLLSTAPLPDDQIAGFYMKMEQDSTIADYCGIYFSKNWSDAYDQEDAIDLDGASPKVYMSSYTSDTRRTAINDLSDYKGGKTIKLYVNAIADGIYKLKIEQIKNIDPLYDIWLKDNFKKDSLDFRNNSIYSFNVARSDATTFGADRFTLVIRRKVLPAYQFISLKGSLSGPAINVSWKVQNEYNFTGFTVEKLNAANQYDALTYIQSNGSGTYSYVDKTPYTGVNTYRIKQDDIDSKISYSTAVSVNTIKTNPQNGKFMIYPNPAATTTLNIQFVDSFTGSVNVMVANSSGTVISQQVFTQQQGTIDISRLKTGVYFIKAASQQSGQEIGSEGFIKL